MKPDLIKEELTRIHQLMGVKLIFEAAGGGLLDELFGLLGTMTKSIKIKTVLEGVSDYNFQQAFPGLKKSATVTLGRLINNMDNLTHNRLSILMRIPEVRIKFKPAILKDPEMIEWLTEWNTIKDGDVQVRNAKLNEAPSKGLPDDETILNELSDEVVADTAGGIKGKVKALKTQMELDLKQIRRDLKGKKVTWKDRDLQAEYKAKLDGYQSRMDEIVDGVRVTDESVQAAINDLNKLMKEYQGKISSSWQLWLDEHIGFPMFTTVTKPASILAIGAAAHVWGRMFCEKEDNGPICLYLKGCANLANQLTAGTNSPDDPFDKDGKADKTDKTDNTTTPKDNVADVAEFKVVKSVPSGYTVKALGDKIYLTGNLDPKKVASDPSLKGKTTIEIIYQKVGKEYNYVSTKYN